MRGKKKARRTDRDIPTLAENQVLEPLFHVWLAGLGAVSRARAEGPKVLNELIREGVRAEAHERKVVKKAVRSTLDDAQALVRRVVDELPPVRVLKEIRALRSQVAAMNAKIEKLAQVRRAPSKRRIGQRPRSAR